MQNFTYIVEDEGTDQAVIIDPSWNLPDLELVISRNNLKIKYIINTHHHFDHTLGNEGMAASTAAKIVQHEYSDLRHDVAVSDGDVIRFGNSSLTVLYTPGHSRDGICLIGDGKLFSGDTLFVGSCGRIDLPGGSSRELYHSLFDKLYPLDDSLVLYSGHNYGHSHTSTLGDEKNTNLGSAKKDGTGICRHDGLMSTDFTLFGDVSRAQKFIDGIGNGRFLFSLVTSYTGTCEIPGITFAGADIESVRFTPAADAEYLYYGSCKTVKSIPMTPDGKPTPALLTKTALESASIPHIAINAGCIIPPRLPCISTGLEPGGNISEGAAMSESAVNHAMDYGRIVGRTLASMTDCLVIGESIPGGTTTALAVLYGLGFDAKVSSSMANNPVALKNRIAAGATRGLSGNPYEILARAGDPMLAFVTGMLSSASYTARVMLAGGTQMAAVLGLASRIGFNERNTILGTTSYILNDNSANLEYMVSEIADIPAISVDPGLADSKYPGLRAYSEGFVKEGVGAGGAIISYMLKTGNESTYFTELAQKEYRRIFT